MILYSCWVTIALSVFVMEILTTLTVQGQSCFGQFWWSQRDTDHYVQLPAWGFLTLVVYSNCMPKTHLAAWDRQTDGQ